MTEDQFIDLKNKVLYWDYKFYKKEPDPAFDRIVAERIALGIELNREHPRQWLIDGLMKDLREHIAEDQRKTRFCENGLKSTKLFVK